MAAPGVSPAWIMATAIGTEAVAQTYSGTPTAIASTTSFRTPRETRWGATLTHVAGGLEAMEIEHYPGMTERAISAIRDEAVARRLRFYSYGDAMFVRPAPQEGS
mgnify:CR=1 FL=1